jgi:hypothetical protein
MEDQGNIRQALRNVQARVESVNQKNTKLGEEIQQFEEWNKAILKENEAILKENEAVLKENEAILKESEAILKENEDILEDNKRLEPRIEHLEVIVNSGT